MSITDNNNHVRGNLKIPLTHTVIVILYIDFSFMPKRGKTEKRKNLRKFHAERPGKKGGGYMDSKETKVKAWLKNYRTWKAFTINANKRIEGILQELRLSPAPAAVRYGGVPGGGKSGQGDSMEERYMERQQELKDLITDLKERSRTARENTMLIDLAISSLCPTDQAIVRYRVEEGLTWDSIGVHCGYDPSWCRRRWKKAIQEIALILFPDCLEQ